MSGGGSMPSQQSVGISHTRSRCVRLETTGTDAFWTLYQHGTFSNLEPGYFFCIKIETTKRKLNELRILAFGIQLCAFTFGSSEFWILSDALQMAYVFLLY